MLTFFFFCRKKFKKFPRSQIIELEQDENNHEVDSEEESDPTIVPKATYKKSYQCMNCLTDESKIWRRSPSDFDRKRKVFSKVLCDDCGIYWLKYAKTKPIAPEKKSANSTPTLSIMMTGIEEDRKRKRSTDNIKTVLKKQKENVSSISCYLNALANID